MRSLLATTVIAATVCAVPATARAEAEEEPRTRDVRLAIGGNVVWDVAFVGLHAGGLYLATKYLHPTHGDRAPLDGLGHRTRVEAFGKAADVAVMVGLTAGASLSFLAGLGTDVRGVEVLRGPVITLEGALAGSLFTQFLKNAFGICRPRDWENATRKCGTGGERGNDEESIDEAHRSFPSGHSAPLAGMAGAALGLYVLPSPVRSEHLAVALTSVGFAVTVVILREKAGAHSWVDVAAAFLSGGIAGFATAALHLHSTPVADAPTAPAAAPVTTTRPAMFTLGAPF